MSAFPNQESLKRTVGEHLREVRKSKGLQHAEMSESLDVTSPGVYKAYEYGDRGMPYDLLYRLAVTHDVNLNWLLSVEDLPMHRSVSSAKCSERAAREIIDVFVGALAARDRNQDLSGVKNAALDAFMALLRFYSSPADDSDKLSMISAHDAAVEPLRSALR